MFYPQLKHTEICRWGTTCLDTKGNFSAPHWYRRWSIISKASDKSSIINASMDPASSASTMTLHFQENSFCSFNDLYDKQTDNCYGGVFYTPCYYYLLNNLGDERKLRYRTISLRIFLVHSRSFKRRSVGGPFKQNGIPNSAIGTSNIFPLNVIFVAKLEILFGEL